MLLDIPLPDTNIRIEIILNKFVLDNIIFFTELRYFLEISFLFDARELHQNFLYFFVCENDPVSIKKV